MGSLSSKFQGMLDSLKTREATAQRQRLTSYRQLVLESVQLATDPKPGRGKIREDAEVEAVLAAVGKSADDLAGDVEREVEALGLRTISAEEPELNRQRNAISLEQEALQEEIKAFQRQVEARANDLAARSQAVMAKLQRVQSARAELRELVGEPCGPRSQVLRQRLTELRAAIQGLVGTSGFTNLEPVKPSAVEEYERLTALLKAAGGNADQVEAKGERQVRRRVDELQPAVQPYKMRLRRWQELQARQAEIAAVHEELEALQQRRMDGEPEEPEAGVA